MPGVFLPDRLHIHHVLLYLFLSNYKMREAESQMAYVYKEGAPHYDTGRNWYHRFENGDYSVEDKERSGRPSEVILAELRNLAESDPSQTTREIASVLGVS